jgi:hypothetical protein
MKCSIINKRRTLEQRGVVSTFDKVFALRETIDDLRALQPIDPIQMERAFAELHTRNDDRDIGFRGPIEDAEARP